MEMDKEFVRKPYVLKAVQVTKANFEEIAEMIGTIITPKNGGKPYIETDRQKVPFVTRVYVGFWMTVKGTSIRCYSPRTFREQFVQNTPDIQVWVDWMNPQDSTVGDLNGAQAVEA